MQFQSYKIADLIPASYNPRKKLKPGDKEYEKIKNSIREFGYVEPIIINSDMTIIGGHRGPRSLQTSDTRKWNVSWSISTRTRRRHLM